MNIGVLCENQETAEKIAFIDGVDTVYSHKFPLAVSDRSARGKRWIQLLPYVFRKDTEPDIDEGADGVLIRNFDELGFVREIGYGKEMIADSTLYTMNSKAARELLGDGITAVTCPLELNFKELEERGLADRSELVIYGRAPLMISVNCVYKDGYGACRGAESGKNDAKLCKQHSATRKVMDCNETENDWFCVNLTDRMKTDFPVMCDCRYCYNVIYNSVPTSLHKVMDRILRLNTGSVRIDLTTEETRRAEQIVKYYVNLIKGCIDVWDTDGLFKEFTYGHFKNGVE